MMIESLKKGTIMLTNQIIETNMKLMEEPEEDKNGNKQPKKDNTTQSKEDDTTPSKEGDKAKSKEDYKTLLKEYDIKQLMEYTIRFAEITSQYAKYDEVVTAESRTRTPLDKRTAIFEAAKWHVELKDCYLAKIRMDYLWERQVHFFFRLTEVYNLYSAITSSCYDMSYIIPANEDSRMIKKNLLSKTLFVAFEIWKHQYYEDSKYEYDNESDMSTLQEALALYKADGNEQFIPELDSLLGWILQNAKDSSTKNGRQAKRTTKKA